MDKFENLGMGGQKFFVKFTNRGGSNFFPFSREEVKRISRALKGGSKYFSCYSEFDHPPTAGL